MNAVVVTSLNAAVLHDVATRERDPWRSEAACKGTALDVFFPTNPQQGASHLYDEARRVCGGCPVLMECRVDALIHGDVDGFRAGLSPTQWRHHRPTVDVVCAACGETFASSRAGVVYCARKPCRRRRSSAAVTALRRDAEREADVLVIRDGLRAVLSDLRVASKRRLA